jgi:uncharacterized membrane protein
MKLLRSDLGALAALATSCGASVWGASRLPETVATHFALDGTPNGWMRRATALWLLPAIGAAAWGLVRFAGSFWPRPIGVGAARALPTAAALTAALLAAVHVAVVVGNVVPGFEAARAVLVAVGLFLMLFGLLAPRLPQNPFVGFRTPWTLGSPEIWARTHRLGGATLSMGGCVALVASLVSGAAGPIALGAILVGALVPAAYSAVLGARLREG